jgi:hypothetical protein
MQVAIADVDKELKRALLLVEEACEGEGIDLHGQDFRAQPVLVQTAERRARELATAAESFADAAESGGAFDQELLGTLLSGAWLLGAKTVRLAWQAADPGSREPSWEAILLLLEYSATSVDAAIRKLSSSVTLDVRARLEAARVELDQVWSPWSGGVSPEARRALADLVDNDRAPSPFCRSEGGTRTERAD